ncbi:MAG TPA: hypothetical protein VE913_04580 [Longimicrobium sp.]|nr:hypothetical protein [Longimicrobium sp.]
MKKLAVGILTAVSAVTFVGTAGAQICAGYPTADRGLSFGARADFPDNLDSFGVEASYNAAGPLSVFGGLNVVSVEDVDNSDQDVYFVGAALETPSIGAMIGPTVSVCPQARFEYVDIEGASAFNIPIGLGFGTTLGSTVGGGTISPYVIPQLVISRYEADDNGGADGASESDTYFGVRGGALLGFGQVYVGGEVNYLAGDNSDAVFGIRAGLRF